MFVTSCVHIHFLVSDRKNTEKYKLIKSCYIILTSVEIVNGIAYTEDQIETQLTTGRKYLFVMMSFTSHINDFTFLENEVKKISNI